MWLDVTAVALGGAIGAVARFLTGQISRSVFGEGFPYGTLIVNSLGSFLIALVVAKVASAEWSVIRLHPFVAVGVLGGFTTFSTFSLETVSLAAEGAWGRAALNVVANVVLCLAACWAGLAVAR